MKGLELLEKYPLSATLIRAWFLEKMLESLNDASISDEFKTMMREAGIENDKIGTLIDVNPRMLFDVFDENHILIEIFRPLNEESIYPSNYFSYKIGNISPDIKKTRKETELSAIETAFEILEDNLSEKRMNVIGQNGNTGEHYEN